MENNKLIAEFMQIELISNKEYEIKRRDMIKQDIAYDLPLTLDDLKYHSSWDCLIPVIEKCYVLDTTTYYRTIHYSMESFDIEKVYIEVVDFIENFNN